MLPAAKNDEYKRWREEWLSETRIIGQVFKEKILNYSVHTSEEHFKAEAASWFQ